MQLTAVDHTFQSQGGRAPWSAGLFVGGVHGIEGGHDFSGNGIAGSWTARRSVGLLGAVDDDGLVVSLGDCLPCCVGWEGWQRRMSVSWPWWTFRLCRTRRALRHQHLPNLDFSHNTGLQLPTFDIPFRHLYNPQHL